MAKRAKKREGTVKTSLNLDEKIWDEFKGQLYSRLKEDSYSVGLETVLKEWLAAGPRSVASPQPHAACPVCGQSQVSMPPFCDFKDDPQKAVEWYKMFASSGLDLVVPMNLDQLLIWIAESLGALDTERRLLVFAATAMLKDGQLSHEDSEHFLAILEALVRPWLPAKTERERIGA